MNKLTQVEINEVSGGFVCGGLCIAGAAFAAGALFGAGIAVGRNT
ncbi:class IIb bacteriocin, lactobin A/cerein 7B family [Aliiglaciecola litoralis]|uniref:Class IIb bacteriocin, lactobin A/cerein 7B family n=1 Tax=Aliiglaciecola litoralis TaxID=582857 RepID=A0ABN1LFN9_9ALTE